jgi:quinol monooxygenase YgiN
MLFVIATIRVKSGCRSDVLEHFSRIVPLVRQEEGCLLYAPSIDLETNINAQEDVDPDVITVVEQWESAEALEKHLMAPHMLEYRAAVSELVDHVALKIVEPV